MHAARACRKFENAIIGYVSIRERLIKPTVTIERFYELRNFGQVVVGVFVCVFTALLFMLLVDLFPCLSVIGGNILLFASQPADSLADTSFAVNRTDHLLPPEYCVED